MKKTIAIILTVALFAATFAGCSSTSGTTNGGGDSAATNGSVSDVAGTILADVEEGETYIIVNCLNNIEYFNAHKYAWEQCGELFGVNVQFTGPADDDMVEMGSAFDSAIAQNPAGICVWGYDAALDSYIQKAQEEDIPVVTYVGSTDEQGDCYIGTAQYDLGYQGGKLYADSIGGEGKVSILSITGSDMFEERTRGFEDAFAEYPGIEVVAIGDTKADANTAVNVAKDIVVKNSDLKGFVCADSTGTQGASTALNELGVTGVQVLGLDRNTETLEMVKDGTITGTLVQDDTYTAYWAFLVLFTENHVDLRLTTDDKAANAKSAPNAIYTSVNLVTVDNVDYYLDANETYATNKF